MKMVGFGEILRTIGDFGFFQKLLILGLVYQFFLLSFFYCSIIFIESDPDRHCNTDWILRISPNLTTEEQLNLTLPREKDETFSRCRMFVPVDWDIGAIREYGLNDTTGCRNGWVYGNMLYEATIVTDFDLVCERSHMAEVAQTIFMMGIFAGSLIFGPISDLFGRRRTTQLPVVLSLIFVVVAGVSPNFETYIVSLFIMGAAFAGFFINSIVLATEWTGITRRSFASCLSQLFGCLGLCGSAGLVYVIRDWRKAQYILAGAQAVVFLYIWWIPESGRWLLGQGRTEEAKKLIQQVAAINKKEIPKNLLDQITAEEKVQTKGIKAILTSSVMLKYVLILSSAWFAVNLGYFCLLLNVGKLGLNVFLVQFIFGISEIPAHLLCIWVLELLGRKISLISTLLLGGFVCLVTLAVPQDRSIVITVLVTTGKFFLIWSGTVCMVYVQELFPISVRQTAVGLGSAASRIAGLVSPLLNMLAVYHRSIPIIVFSSLAVFAGGLIFLLPETTSQELPDSTSDAKDIGNMTNKKTTSVFYVTENNTNSTKL